jgi:4-amino-4-deoxy-L-arabinose transferase-like glycosyltransferase
LALVLLVYVPLFWTSGGQRQLFYDTLLRGYLLIPDQLVVDLVDTWRGASAQQSSALSWVVERGTLLSVSLIWLGAALSAGWLSLPLNLRRSLTQLETTTLSIVVGLQWLSLYTLFVGLAGALHVPILFWLPALGLPFLALGRHCRLWTSQRWREPSRERQARERQARERQAREDGWRQRPLSSAGWALLVIVPMFFILVLAAVPPWDFDVREYHAQVPKEWFLAGRIGFLPHNVYGNMPLGGELHALATTMLLATDLPGLRFEPAWWYGALAGKIILACYSFLGASGVHSLVRRAVGGYVSNQTDLARWSARLAALAYLVTPWIVDVSITGMNEGAVAACFVWALYAWWRWDEARGARLRVDSTAVAKAVTKADAWDERRWLGLTGFLAGSAVACKYTAVVMVALPLAVLVIYSAWPERRVVYRGLMVLIVGAVLAAGPWFVKNAMLTGNPTYPLLYPLFGGRAWDEATHQRWQRAHRAPHDASGHQYHLQQFMESVPVMGWRSDKLSMFLWPLAMVGICCAPRGRLKTALLTLLGANGLTWWLLTHRLERFLVPDLPLLACLAGLGVAELSGRRERQSVLIFFTLSFLLNGIFFVSPAMLGDKRWLVPLKDFRTDSVMPARLNPVHRYLNEHVPLGKQAVLIGDAAVFDLEVPITYHTCWNPSPLDDWLGRGNSDTAANAPAPAPANANAAANAAAAVATGPAVLREEFKRRGVSHVYFHWPEIARYRSPGNYGFPSEITAAWVEEELVGRQRLLKPVDVPGVPAGDSSWGQLYEVMSAAGDPRP